MHALTLRRLSLKEAAVGRRGTPGTSLLLQTGKRVAVAGGLAYEPTILLAASEGVALRAVILAVTIRASSSCGRLTEASAGLEARSATKTRALVGAEGRQRALASPVAATLTFGSALGEVGPD